MLDLPFTAVEWVIPADAPSLAPEGVPPAKWALFARTPPPREQSLTGWDTPPPPFLPADCRCLQVPAARNSGGGARACMRTASPGI